MRRTYTRPTNLKDLYEKIINQTIVIENGCFIYCGSKSKSGYGKLTYKRRNLRAHRAIWECINGEIPEGMVICHKCDNRSCVNLDHLFIGTSYENNCDMITKKRHKNQAKLFCPMGHHYSLENTIYRGLHRICARCRKLMGSRGYRKLRKSGLSVTDAKIKIETELFPKS